ncbi:MAG TPA: hypothetical protein VHE55_07785 [Fimbriimonadaceae bacterium]|nr:hypothetical protein [Fimbriimonadaceae bacterium]
MSDNIQMLAGIGSQQTGKANGRSPRDLTSLPLDLGDLLAVRDGFYAFESALHVFSSSPALAEPSLAEWNSSDLWRKNYDGLDDALFFFAEDIFGEQFGIGERGVYRFNPETGEKTLLTATVEDWAGLMLREYNVETGYPIAQEWQRLHGRLPVGSRLIPKVFFVLGGEYAVDNLYLLEAAKAMRLRGDLAVQIRDLPDGAKVRIKTVE